MEIAYGEPLVSDLLETFTLADGNLVEWIRYADGADILYGGCTIRKECPIAACSRCHWEWYRRMDLD